jgi:hypothetical protein
VVGDDLLGAATSRGDDGGAASVRLDDDRPEVETPRDDLGDHDGHPEPPPHQARGYAVRIDEVGMWDVEREAAAESARGAAGGRS